MQPNPALNQAITRATTPTSAPLAAPIIQMNGISRIFPGDVGVFNLNLQVPSGVLFGLIGPSGSGKTTTVRLLTGLYKPDQGNITVLGETPTHFRGRTRERIGYMPQQFVLYPNLTVWENLNFVASIYGMGYLKRRKPLKRVLDFVELTDARDRLGSQLSGGMQRRLELASALVHDPPLVFADEPTAGVDPVLRAKFWEQFRALRDAGRTLVITTQYVGEAAYCDLVGVMRAGRLIHIDTPEGLRRRAMGGEVIKIVVDPPHTLDAIQLLQRQVTVNDVRRSHAQPGLLYVYTEDAAGVMPELLARLHQQAGLRVQEAEPYVPPFDDVFIRLMEQDENT
jgi:ABC-2 type transport system ATP-binding protein